MRHYAHVIFYRSYNDEAIASSCLNLATALLRVNLSAACDVAGSDKVHARSANQHVAHLQIDSATAAELSSMARNQPLR